MKIDASIFWTLACLTLSFCAGCGNGLDMGTVSGTVTLDGQPLPGASLQFYPTAGGRASFGKTDAEGKYQLVYSSTDLGALQGEHTVEITTNIEDETGTMQKERVPANYRGMESELKATVVGGKNVIDFPLSTSAKEKSELDKFNAAQERDQAG